MFCRLLPESSPYQKNMMPVFSVTSTIQSDLYGCEMQWEHLATPWASRSLCNLQGCREDQAHRIFLIAAIGCRSRNITLKSGALILVVASIEGFVGKPLCIGRYFLIRHKERLTQTECRNLPWLPTIQSTGKLIPFITPTITLSMASPRKAIAF